MKGKLTKILSLTLMLVMLVSVAAACGDTGTLDPTPAAPGPADPAPADPAPADPGTADPAPADTGEFNAVEITYQVIGWHSPSDSAMAELSAKVNERLAELGKPYTVKLVYRGGPPEYDDVTNLMLASGANEFDLIFISNWAANYFANAAAGYLTDLNPYLEKYPAIEDLLGTGFMRASLVNGGQFALPVNKEKARQVGWILRQDIIDEMGYDLNDVLSLSYEQRLDKLEEWFYEVNNELGLWVFQNFIPCDMQFQRVIEPLIGVVNETNDYTALIQDLTPQYIEHVKRISQWYQDGLVSPDLNINSSGDDEFKTGNYFAVSYQLKPGKAAENQANFGDLFPLVQVELNPPEIANDETTGAMIAIPVGAPNKNEAFDFINLMYTDSILINTILFGKEGIDFEFVDRDRGIVEITGGGGYSNTWTMGDQYKNYLTTNEDPEKWNQFIAFNEAGESKVLSLVGFVPDTSSTDVQTWMAGMRAVRDNYDDLFKGYVPLDRIDDTFAQLASDYEAAGSVELLAEMQRQIDAWRAS